MSQPDLFRKTAIDKLSSPEQLDALMEVTSPKGWVALGTIGGILLGIIIWSVAGSIPTRVQGEGILIRGGSLREIVAPAGGQLLELSLAINENVKDGQVIAKIDQPDLAERARNARAKYEEMERDYQSATFEDQATIEGQRATIDAQQAQLVKVKEELESKRRSFEKGLITKDRMLALEREKVSLEANIRSLRASIPQMEQRLRSRRMAVDDARRAWTEVMKTGDRVSTLTSAVEGRVIEIKKTPGDQVRPGDVIAIVEPSSAVLEPVFYVISTKGKQIQPGMEAQISPSTVKKEEYGFMRAAVKAVGQYPATPDAVQSVVANEALANELLAESAQIEVRATLTPEPNTPSGFAWSSSAGPPFMIASGTRVSVSVIVDRRAPITYVLPIIRSALGMS